MTTKRELLKRVQRLEASFRAQQAREIILQFAYLKTLPREYKGERRAVIVKRLPSDERGNEWFEMEERPGPSPVSEDNHILRVCFVTAESRPD